MKVGTIKKKYALISAYDKSKLELLCKYFLQNDINIISTGNTLKYIKKLGYKCQSVSGLTKFKEILNGRVKTLHPKIHASLLYDRKNIKHQKTFKTLNFPAIDFLFVNLYPFEKIINKKLSEDKCIEMIDVGGPAMLRAASKNFKYVTTICNITDYKKFIENIAKNNGETTLEFRKEMAQKVFSKISKYDLTISRWFLKGNKKLPKNKTAKSINLRYGENPHQKATISFVDKKPNILDLIIQGKQPSYNNILDIDSAISCLSDFTSPTCVIIKHNNPCAVASGDNILQAFRKAINCDPVSSYGGIISFNKVIDGKLAIILKKFFFEIIIAKNFTNEAKEVFRSKLKTILISTSNIKIDEIYETKSVLGGTITQEKNLFKINANSFDCVTYKNANKKEIEDLIFAFKVCKHTKSNAIVLVNNRATIGLGVGQMSRIDATKIAILKAKQFKNNKYFVAASDAFFPFNDSLKILIKNNCRAIAQPGGSINVSNLIKYENTKKIPVYFSKIRSFKH